MMDRQIRRLGLALLALFVLLFAQTNYISVFAAGRLADNPANSRVLLAEYNMQRGAILARDERTVLAKSVATNGTLKYLRVYPHGSLYGQITGYYSLIYGRSGLELSQNDWLSGTAAELTPQNLVDEILGRPKRGATVVTTLDAKLQRVAASALGNLPGAVVALDPRTGGILAMVGNPSYDPNPLASHDSATQRAAWRTLSKDPDKPLLSPAAQQLYPPGSTFKLVTASAALEAGATPSTTYANPAVLQLPQTTHVLQNFGGEHCLGGAPRITMAQALQVSCNVVFGEIGLQLGAARLVAQARRFGFDQDVPFEIPFAEGQIPDVSTFVDNEPLVALSAIGQASVRANPLAMALVAQAIANGGTEMVPQLVRQVRDSSGRVVKTFSPQVFGNPISAKTAAEMTSMMIGVVQGGTGTAAQIPGVTVAGKTGTAEVPGGNPDAWFVSFAPAQNPKIVVAVIVPNGGSLGSDATGGAVAAPIAKAVIEAALG
ncbi:MAG TPA: penicillin-binding transpeptidase domain-containing protein [Actinomycetota bacterium]|jgi:peptidoglycan glycosyltransferase